MTDAAYFFDMDAAPPRIGTHRRKVHDLDAVRLERHEIVFCDAADRETLAVRAESAGFPITTKDGGITLPWGTVIALTH